MTILGITDWSGLHCLIEFFVDLISWLEHHLSNDKYPSDLILFFFLKLVQAWMGHRPTYANRTIWWPTKGHGENSHVGGAHLSKSNPFLVGWKIVLGQEATTEIVVCLVIGGCLLCSLRAIWAINYSSMLNVEDARSRFQVLICLGLWVGPGPFRIHS